MPVDWRIPGSAQGLDISNLGQAYAQGQQIAQNKQSKGLNSMNLSKARKDAIFDSQIENSHMVQQAIASGNLDQLSHNLERKAQGLEQSGRDATETRGLSKYAQMRDIGSLQAFMNTVQSQGRALGKLVAPTDTRTTNQKDAVFAFPNDEGAQRDAVGSKMTRSPMSVTTQINNSQDSIEKEVNRVKQVKKAEEDVKRTATRQNDILANVQQGGISARELISTIDLQDSIGFQSGPGESTMDMGRRAVVGTMRLFGADENSMKMLDSISDNAQFLSIQESLVGKRLAAEPGVKTDGDALRMRKTLANIDNPVEANKFISRYMRAEAVRMDNREKFYEENRGKDIDEITEDWNNFVRDSDLSKINPETGKIMFLYEFIEQSNDRLRLPEGHKDKINAEDVYALWRQLK